jgi:hypothetical protein
MSDSIRMDSLANLQIQTNPSMLLQMLPHNLQLIYVTPNAGRPQASQRAGADMKKTLERNSLNSQIGE